MGVHQNASVEAPLDTEVDLKKKDAISRFLYFSDICHVRIYKNDTTLYRHTETRVAIG